MPKMSVEQRLEIFILEFAPHHQEFLRQKFNKDLALLLAAFAEERVTAALDSLSRKMEAAANAGKG